MKKLMIAAVAIAAGVAFADEIKSANIVGYAKSADYGDVSLSLEVGVAFSNVGVEGGAYTIGDDIFGTPAVDGDVFLIFNPTAYNYDYYQYMDDGSGENMIWQITDMATYETINVESFDVQYGDSVVFLPCGGDVSRALTVSGQVADLTGGTRTWTFDIDQTEDFSKWYQPITNPFPIDTTKKMLDDLVVDGDVLLVWSDSAYNYDYYQYIDDGTGKMIWQITDMATYELRTIEGDDEIVLPAGHGAVFCSVISGVRTWTVTLK